MTAKIEAFGSGSKLAFGIDLGTTNSNISVVRTGGMAEIIKLDDGSVTMPSCVMWKGDDKFIVGKEAYRSRYKPSVAYSTKRLIGSDEKVQLKYGRKVMETDPVFIASKVLEGLVEKVSHMYPNIKDVVITVPAYFNHNQVDATLKAGEMANLNVLKILREPTAAAHAYTVEGVGTREETILIYDLGGGTFDVSVLKISIMDGEVSTDFGDLYGIEATETSGKSVYQVLAVGGDNRLGGDDIDHELLKIALDKLKARGIDIEAISKEDVNKLLLSLEQVKKRGVGQYSVPFSFKIKGTNYSEEIEINNVDFDNAIYVIYRKTRQIMKSTVLNSGVGDSIDRIVLVGGSTKSDIIRGYLKRDFPKVEISHALNPDESVSLGAAVMARKEKFGDDSISSTDVLPIGIGVVADDRLRVMIKSGQSLPHSVHSAFQTTIDDQEEIEIEVRQGNSTIVDNSVYLGNLIIKGLPRRPAGKVSVSVGLKINSEGLLTCSASCEGKAYKAEIINIFSKMEEKGKKMEDQEDRTVKMIVRFNKLADKYAGGATEGKVRAVIKSLQEGKLDVTSASKEISSIITEHNDLVSYNTSASKTVENEV